MNTKLREIRLSLKVSQEYMARVSNLSLQTYRSAELGNNVSYSTAVQVADALSGELAKRGKAPVDALSLGLSIV